MNSTLLYSEANFYIDLLAIMGLVVAFYSYYVKVRYLKDPLKYKAVCDINENMSCTRVLSSKYGTGFGIVGKLFGQNSALNISNSVYGSIFYLLQIIFTFYNYNETVKFLAFSSSALSIIGSIYLAYILFFVLRDFCLVCTATYIINAFIFYYNWLIYMN